MTAWLLKNWLPLGAAATLTALVAFGLHTLSIQWINASHAFELKQQETALTAKCDEEKRIPNEVSSAYQNQIANLNRRLAELKRVQPQCVIPTGSEARPGYNDGAQHAELSGRNGISTEWLLDFAGRCEQVGLQLDAAQEFIRRTSGD